jgi:hypothetical protein
MAIPDVFPETVTVAVPLMEVFDCSVAVTVVAIWLETPPGAV